MNQQELDVQLNLEERTLKDNEGKNQTFFFHVVRSPEDWPVADHARGTYDLPTLGTNRVTRFNLRGLSLAEWEAMESEHIVPRWTGEGQAPPEHEQQVASAVAEKMAAVFELSTGKKIPGETMAEKAAYLKRMNEGETNALYYFIQNQICNFMDGPLLMQYDTFNSRSGQKEVTDFNGFEDWKTAATAEYFFRMHRSPQDYLVEFPLKSLDTDSRLQIENETRDPTPPNIPKRDPNSKKIVRGEWMPNYEDPTYKKSVRAISQKRTVMYLQACLPFELPGTNILEKYQWLSHRLAGDVVRLKRFVEYELISYESRYNFFTKL